MKINYSKINEDYNGKIPKQYTYSTSEINQSEINRTEVKRNNLINLLYPKIKKLGLDELKSLLKYLDN